MTPILMLVALVGGLALLGFLILNSGAVRNAGFPHSLADLEGRWVLDRTRGEFEVAPPETLVFRAGSAAELVQVTDGIRTAEFTVKGLGQLAFIAGHHFEPLLPAGASTVHTMTHLCPPVPAWDHLIFYPDGQPSGPNKRVFVYERE